MAESTARPQVTPAERARRRALFTDFNQAELAEGRELPEQSDLDLVADFLDGDATAFSAIVERHRSRLLWVARRYTSGNEDDAEDILQDALFKASRNLGSYRAEAALSTWLHRLVMNAGYDFKNHRFRREVSTLDEDDAAHDYQDRLAHDPHREHETVLVLRAALDTLNPEQRTALLAVDGAGYTLKSVAAAEGVQPGTIKSRRARGRAALAEALAALSEEAAVS
ncbi:MAG TPA: sigma-70 family RNA polymerase sigma factor [Corynebacterium sp.]|nr:sigma-70 family RNA polymerase sigma factor [Corynebacterium sp.]